MKMLPLPTGRDLQRSPPVQARLTLGVISLRWGPRRAAPSCPRRLEDRHPARAARPLRSWSLGLDLLALQLVRELGVGDPALGRVVEQAVERDVGVPTPVSRRRSPVWQVARARHVLGQAQDLDRHRPDRRGRRPEESTYAFFSLSLYHDSGNSTARDLSLAAGYDASPSRLMTANMSCALLVQICSSPPT